MNIPQFLPILLLLVMVYVMILLPNKKRRLAHQALMKNLQEGDEVLTASGLFGYVHAVEEKVVWVEIAENVIVRVANHAISNVVPPDTSDMEHETTEEPEEIASEDHSLDTDGKAE
jgi:preprotein translocase subunit YajC